MSTFEKGYRCWKKEDARAVLDYEALNVPDSVFGAVHYPMRFYRRDQLPGEATGFQPTTRGNLWDEERFLEDVLDPEVDYKLVPVIGHSGTGKSHLIRWLAARTKESSERRVILVPRAGTNLREVIRRILEGMQGEPFDDFRKRLLLQTENLSEEQGRSRLLDRLAELIEFEWQKDREKVSRHNPEKVDFLDYAAEKAPSFLRDPFFRKKWLIPGGVIARLYDLALGAASDIDRIDERRRFQLEDLPVDVADAPYAAQETQDFYYQLTSSDELREALVEVLNYYLDAAVRGLLNLSSEDLVSLMREVRRELRRRGRELVLYIEDIARLQGIDLQLLDALIERPGDALCALRAVIGSTDGYFGNLPNTFRTRCTYLVDLNVKTEDLEDRDKVIVGMTARYLNATRLGVEQLEEWHKSGEPVLPSACEECPFREACHGAFGADNGVGLYPFNATALRQMYQRTQAQGINPRFLLRDVLRRVMVNYYEDLGAGRFPSITLHDEFGGISDRWSPEALRRVERSVSSGEYQRHLALLDLWTTAREPVKLPDAVYEAFKLLPPRGVAATSSDEQPHPQTPNPPQHRSEPLVQRSTPHTAGGSSLPERTQSLLEALDRWSRGGNLEQSKLNDLRGIVFWAVQAYIDWDSERLTRGLLSGSSSGPFQRSSINFADQGTQRAGTEVSIELPLAEGPNRRDTALALKGLILYQHHGNWGFKDGADRLLDYARLMEAVSQEVLHQLRHPAGEAWNPGVAAAELLVLGARLHGKPPASRTTIEDRLDALYEPWQGQSEASTTRAWSSLAGKFAKAQEKLLEMLEAYLLCPKGGSRQTKILDTACILDIFRRNNLMPREAVPESVPVRLRFLQQLQNDVRKLLVPALREEEQWWKDWLQDLDAKFGESSVEEVRTAVNDVRAYLEDHGLQRLAPQRLEELKSLSRQLREADLIQLRPLAQRIADASMDNDIQVSALARDVGYASTLVTAAHRLRRYGELVEEMCSRTEEYLAQQMDALQGGDELSSIIDDLEKTLNNLCHLLGDQVTPSEVSE
ncbi:MAG: hypothetical protein KatS3mg015_2424 [Fimbriimonadales bacterium]|nr:MAG: hypothetical protein KatS3mg015_2424 [Fimbriimonadales bacterium]